MAHIIQNDYLQHHGILGMKWGVRRFQPYSVRPRGSGKGGMELIDKISRNKRLKESKFANIEKFGKSKGLSWKGFS